MHGARLAGRSRARARRPVIAAAAARCTLAARLTVHRQPPCNALRPVARAGFSLETVRTLGVFALWHLELALVGQVLRHQQGTIEDVGGGQ